MTAHYSIHDNIAVITLDNPPVNSMGIVTRTAIGEGVAKAIADASVAAIVITGANGIFTGGADIREFGLPVGMQSPNLHDLIRTFEASPKPVISAINAVSMGGGTEISLSVHYRVAAPNVKIGLPEVKIGLLPGAGGTQRLSRVAGPELALQMIVSGDAVTAEVLRDAGAIDRIIEGDFLTGAVAFAREVATQRPLPLARDRVIDFPNAAAFFAEAKASVKAANPHYPAPLACVEAIEASVLRNFDDGLAYEFTRFTELLDTPESAELRAAFFATRAAKKPPKTGE